MGSGLWSMSLSSIFQMKVIADWSFYQSIAALVMALFLPGVLRGEELILAAIFRVSSRCKIL